jgi:hypothetical protein
VFTEPWWHLVGVIDELHTQEGAREEFDAFIRLGDLPPAQDFQAGLSLIDPLSQQVIAEQQALARSDSKGSAARAVSLTCEFAHEGVYEAHILYNDDLVDVQRLPVLLF